MSLHLGNLSPRVWRDDLERVFRRFGQCTVQVKDKFGFVIYQYPRNAETALRALHGKSICGERITVSWSNRQPRPLQRHSGGDRNSRLASRKNYGREHFALRNLGSNIEDNDRRRIRQAGSGGERLDSAELTKEPRGQHSTNKDDHVRDKKHEICSDLPEEDGIAEENVPENDRWGEVGAANESSDGLDFDRYEPYLGDDSKEQDEFHISLHLDGSSLVSKPIGGAEIDHIGNPSSDHLNKSQKSCYVCGQVGHEKRRCPNELKRHANRSRGLHMGRKAASKVQHNSDRKVILSRNHQKRSDHVDSPVTQSTKRVRKKNYQEMKRCRREETIYEKCNPKKVRLSVSSIYSDCPVSRSYSRSRSRRSPSGSGTRSRSTSVPSRKKSPASRSGSTSCHPKSKELESQSVLRSTSSTLLSVSPARPVPSSPNELLMGQKESQLNSSGSEFDEASAKGDTLVRPNAALDNAKLQIWMAGAANENSAEPLKVEVLDNIPYQNNDDTGHPSVASDFHEINVSCIGHSENDNHEKGVSSPRSMQETTDFKSDGFVRENDLVPLKNIDAEAHEMCHDTIPKYISAREMHMILRNYGLERPPQNGKDFSPENYFGSARMWPWEIIYYRRLKKGPISKDNYDRRLAQNEEFRIIDKYIRSSSGWGEWTDENP